MRTSRNADRETGQIVLVFVIHARHFSGFATDQTGTSLYAAVGNASHNLLEQCWIVLAAGDVIQEEQRFRTLSGNIVDTHGHAVDADGVVLVGHLGNDQLGADASVPEISTGSLYPREARSNRPPKPPIPPTTPGRLVRATWDLMRLTTS